MVVVVPTVLPIKTVDVQVRGGELVVVVVPTLLPIKMVGIQMRGSWCGGVGCGGGGGDPNTFPYLVHWRTGEGEMVVVLLMMVVLTPVLLPI